MRFLKGIGISVENLKVQLANDAISPRLAGATAILQSILWSLSPCRSYKKKTASLAQQAVQVAVRISALIETTREMPQLLNHYLAQFEEILRDIQCFIQLETQSCILHRLFSATTIRARYTILEERLIILPLHFEQYIMHSANPNTGQSRTPSLRSAKHGDTVGSGTILSGAHHLTINGGHFFNGQFVAQLSSHQEPDHITRGDIPVIAREDISTDREIHIYPEYRLYSGSTSGKGVIIKCYRGPRAKERCLDTAEFYKEVMHPSFPPLIGLHSIHSKVPFLVFHGEFEGTLEASIAMALKKDDRSPVILGLQTVISLSSAFSYLRDLKYHFISAGLEHFGVFLSPQGKIIINFDPYLDNAKINDDDYEDSSEVDKRALLIFHEVCKQTFDAACKGHYEGQHVERAYEDVLENEDLFEDVNGISNFEEDDASSSSGDESSPHQTILDSAAPSRQASSQRSRSKPPTNGHRRELVWKSESEQEFSLEDIFHEFTTFHDDLTSSSGPELHRRRGRYTARTAHRCPGYNRTEITLTPNITRNAIVSHSTPLPREICPVCMQVVKDAENFNCICGGEDNEFVATIQCSRCYEWHHRPCAVSFKPTDQCFICPKHSPIFSLNSEHEPVKKWGANGPISYQPDGGIISRSGQLMFVNEDSDDDDDLEEDDEDQSLFNENLGLGELNHRI